MPPTTPTSPSDKSQPQSPNGLPDPKLDPYEWAEQLMVQRLKEHRLQKEAEQGKVNPKE